MFKTAMNNRNVTFWIAVFIFSCIYLVQCKYLHRRNEDTGVDRNGESSAPDKMIGDGESSAPDKMDSDGDSSAPDKMDGNGDSSTPDKMDGNSDSSASDQTDGDGESEDHAALDNKNELPIDTEGPNDVGNDVAEDVQTVNVDVLKPDKDSEGNSSNCWFPIEAHKHFLEMNKLDRKYKDIRNEQRAASSKEFDKKMLDAMLKTRSIAERALQNFEGDANLIPAGLNLGGYCMMRMPQSVLFFHRLKLRNNTRFRINFLENDLNNMLLTVRLSLNDLHLLGDYERAITYSSPSTLYYTPTFGELEFLLKAVEYEVEGRYRLLSDRLYVEHIISDLQPKAILMRYKKENNTASMTTIKLQEKNIYQYLQRMQNDLDLWLKDYFNDFLINFDLPQTNVNPQNQEYENEKTRVRNRFADTVIKGVRRRLRHVNASSIMIPNFKIYTVSEMEISLYDGVIRGLDTIYRRSVATGKLDKNKVRHLDTIVAFSSLKVEYKYEMFLRNGLPPLFGMLVMDADELTGRLALQTVRDSPTLDMHFSLMPPVSEARSLVVEGPANRYIAKYKNILEHQITSIMSSTMIHYMQQLDSLARCDTHLIGKDDPNYKTIDEVESVETNIVTTPADNGQSDGDVNNEPGKLEPDGNDKPGKVDPSGKKGKKFAEDYIVSKKESMELEFPPKDGEKNGEKMLVKVNEKFSLTRLNKDETFKGNTSEKHNFGPLKKDAGYGTEWIFFPDGDGIPHFVNLSLHSPRQMTQSLKLKKNVYRLYARDTNDYILLDRVAKPIGHTYARANMGKMLSNKPIKLVTHGWMSSADNSFVMDLKNAYLKNKDFIVIVVDWSDVAMNYLYPTVADETEAVGSQLGHFLSAFCKRYVVSGDRIHLIGHSLGAHVMGIAASSSNMAVGRITGLDPARPLFEYPKKQDSLSLEKSDAKFVDVIHSCSGILGVQNSIGHVDFYPNSGKAPQPGCHDPFYFLESCSHGRSHVYFTESINNPTAFIASRHRNWEEYLTARERGHQAFMGDGVDHQAKGQYYLKTNSEVPYGRTKV